MVPSLGTLHETVGVAAMAGGRHVLLEKPIAVSPASADRLVAEGAALPAGQVLMVAENSQYWPEVVEALGLIESGAIGEVCTARAKYWESASPALNESTPGLDHFCDPIDPVILDLVILDGCAKVRLSAPATPPGGPPTGATTPARSTAPRPRASSLTAGCTGSGRCRCGSAGSIRSRRPRAPRSAT